MFLRTFQKWSQGFETQIRLVEESNLEELLFLRENETLNNRHGQQHMQMNYELGFFSNLAQILPSDATTKAATASSHEPNMSSNGASEVVNMAGIKKQPVHGIKRQ